jgi:hypothetical protein
LIELTVGWASGLTVTVKLLVALKPGVPLSVIATVWPLEHQAFKTILR